MRADASPMDLMAGEGSERSRGLDLDLSGCWMSLAFRSLAMAPTALSHVLLLAINCEAWSHSLLSLGGD